MSAPDRIIYAWREEQGDVWTGEWALDRADKWVPAEAREYILVTAHEAAVAAARAEGMDPELVSEQRIKYEKIAARVSVGKASQQEACDAIMQLCRDNERLAEIIGRLRAEASA